MSTNCVRKFGNSDCKVYIISRNIGKHMSLYIRYGHMCSFRKVFSNDISVEIDSIYTKVLHLYHMVFAFVFNMIDDPMSSNILEMV